MRNGEENVFRRPPPNEKKYQPPFTIEPCSLIVMQEERRCVAPIFFSSEKCIRLDFLDEEVKKVWAFPPQCISKIMYCILPCKLMWFALHIPPLPEKIPMSRKIRYEIVFTVYQDKSANRENLLRFFHDSCTSAEIKRVCPVIFCSEVGSECQYFLASDLFADDGKAEVTSDEKNIRIIRESQEILNSTNMEINLTHPEEAETDQIILRFRDGEQRTIGHQFLMKSLSPKGWLCTSLMDIMLEYYRQEQISLFAEWCKRVVFYETTFFQKLYKHKDLLQTVTKDNYPTIMQEIYPMRGGVHRGVPVFQKELLVIPIIIAKHWFLVLVHRPMDAQIDEDTEFSLDLKTSKKRCRILILDAKTDTELIKEKLDDLHEEVFNCIKSWVYLMICCIEKYPYWEGSMKIVCKNLPKQTNDYDCGIFTLLFLEEFVLEDWSWTDLSHEKLEFIEVGKIEEFIEKTFTYRDYLSNIVKSIAINLPPTGL